MFTMIEPRNNSTGAANEGTDYTSRGPAVLVVTIIFTVLSFTFTLLRSLSRAFVVGRWKLDDWFIVLAWILAFGFSFSICWAVRYGLGTHDATQNTQYDLHLRQAEYSFSVLYNPVLMATKTSICIFYLTIAKNQRFFRYGVWTTLAVVNVAGVALTFVNAFQCSPASAIVVQEIPEGAVCIDIVAIYLASSPVNIVTDLALLLLPMPMLTAMRMPTRQKIVLVVTFGFGLFVAVVDVIRIAYLQEAFEARIGEVSSGNAITSELLNVQDDFPWYAAYSFMWSAIEVHVGIMCANVPGLKPLAARFFPNFVYDTASQVEHATWRRRKPRNVFRHGCCFPFTHSSANSSDHMQAPDDQGGRYSGSDPRQDRRASTASPLNPELPVARIRSHDFASESNYAANPTDSSGDERRTSTLTAMDEQRSSDTVRPGSDPAIAEDDSHPMDFMEFLTIPTDVHRGLVRQATAATRTTASPTTDPNPTFFDFYNIGNHKCMTELSDREALWPNALVTVLFFLWGVSYGFLEQLNSQFEAVANLNATQSVALHSAYYGAYLIAAPTIGQLVLRKVGFKMTFCCGLCIYGVGTLIFWPSAVLISFPAFLCSNFVVGFGVAVLETSANPFVALCGSPKYAATRLNVSQGVQAVGTVFAPLLARKVLFSGFTESESLIDVQWAYLAIALFDVLLAVVFYYVPLPEASDDDFEAVRLLELPEGRRISEDDRKIPRFVYGMLVLAVIAMFTYVGGQEVVNVGFQAVVRQMGIASPGLDAADWQTLGYGTFALGRFMTAALTMFVPGWIVLGMLYVGVIVSSGLAIGLTGVAEPAMLVLYELFQGGMFPLIYAIGLRGLGKHTKWGAVLLTAATSGGAVWPVVSAGLSSVRGPQIGLVITTAAMALSLFYVLFLGLYGPARHLATPTASRGTEEQPAVQDHIQEQNANVESPPLAKPEPARSVKHNANGETEMGDTVIPDFDTELARLAGR